MILLWGFNDEGELFTWETSNPRVVRATRGSTSAHNVRENLKFGDLKTPLVQMHWFGITQADGLIDSTGEVAGSFDDRAYDLTALMIWLRGVCVEPIEFDMADYLAAEDAHRQELEAAVQAAVPDDEGLYPGS
jgi:hypothetical protein